MAKYIYQRIVIYICILSLFIIISGFFIPGFYTTKYTDCKVIQNIETRHNSADPNRGCNDLGRYVKFSYTDNNGIRHEMVDFWHYNNRIDKSCGKSYYNLTKGHKYKKFNNLTIILFAIFGLSVILYLCTCLYDMDLDDYYGSDKIHIAFFRLDVFSYYCKFIGYPKDIVDLFYKELHNEMDKCPTYNLKIPKYKDMKKELIKLINNEKKNK